jgi:hypothetical protein
VSTLGQAQHSLPTFNTNYVCRSRAYQSRVSPLCAKPVGSSIVSLRIPVAGSQILCHMWVITGALDGDAGHVNVFGASRQIEGFAERARSRQDTIEAIL